MITVKAHSLRKFQDFFLKWEISLIKLYYVLEHKLIKLQIHSANASLMLYIKFYLKFTKIIEDKQYGYQEPPPQTKGMPIFVIR